MATVAIKQVKKRVFKWNNEMVENLIDAISNYKSQMSYRGIDFDGDKPLMYKHLRDDMAKLYCNSDETWMFGPVEFTTKGDMDDNEYKKLYQKETECIAKGRSRIVEKVKDVRQNFSKAVTLGTKSGSGKIVYEFYDKLIEIWGFSANIKPLSFGIKSSEVDKEKINSYNEETEYNVINEESLDHLSTPPQECFSETITSTPSCKTKTNVVPKLIDNKRKHLEKNLSASQRDKLLFAEAKEDAKFKIDLAESLRLSSESFAKSLEQVSNSMVNVGNSMCRSIEMLAMAMQPIQPQYLTQHQPIPTYYNFNAPTYSQNFQDPHPTHEKNQK